jgi:hypothetical protein
MVRSLAGTGPCKQLGDKRLVKRRSWHTCSELTALAFQRGVLPYGISLTCRDVRYLAKKLSRNAAEEASAATGSDRGVPCEQAVKQCFKHLSGKELM